MLYVGTIQTLGADSKPQLQLHTARLSHEEGGPEGRCISDWVRIGEDYRAIDFSEGAPVRLHCLLPDRNTLHCIWSSCFSVLAFGMEDAM